jgi:hypothetical protein
MDTFHRWSENGFSGKYEDSEKTPDLAVCVQNAQERDHDLKWVLEVGFSEPYSQLVEDMKLWLEGTNSRVSTAFLAKLTEDPVYHCPVSWQDRSEIPLKAFEVDEDDVVTNEECFGPAFYRGKQWVGCITEAFMEVWELNAAGQAEQFGDRINLLDTTRDSVQFQLRDFGLEHDGLVSFDLNDFHHHLKESIRILAVGRCQEFIIERNKKAGLESEYVPDKSASKD